MGWGGVGWGRVGWGGVQAPAGGRQRPAASKATFSVKLKVFQFPRKYLWGVLFQNVFSPKAAGWTQPLAFENHGNVENQEFPRFCHVVKRNGPDTGSTMLRNVFSVISVYSNLSQLPYGTF